MKPFTIIAVKLLVYQAQFLGDPRRLLPLPSLELLRDLHVCVGGEGKGMELKEVEMILFYLI